MKNIIKDMMQKYDNIIIVAYICNNNFYIYKKSIYTLYRKRIYTSSI